MSDKLELFICSFMVPEVALVIKNGNYPDVKLASYPANGCMVRKPNFLDGEQAHVNRSNRDKIIVSGPCIPEPDQRSIYRKVKLEQCFELFISKEIIHHYISRGCYLVTNGWLMNLDQHIQDWGFEPDQSTSYFQESIKSILFLDTGISDDYSSELDRLSTYMGVPYDILPIGLSHCKMFIDDIINNWRRESDYADSIKKIADISRQNADFLLIYNKLGAIVELTNEYEIIQEGFELVNILFAPSEIIFKRHYKGSTELLEFHEAFNNDEPTEENSFHIELIQLDQLLGVYEINGIRFPNFVKEYQKMGKLISQIFGLAIANARKYKITIEQKEQLENYSIELQKMIESKDRFFSIIAHDLKGPFSALIGFSNILLEEFRDFPNEDAQKYIQIINSTSHHSYNLLVNLLEWARSESGKMEFSPVKLSLYQIGEENLILLQSQATRKKIAIHNIIPKQLEIFADIDMIHTVFRNLISNAIKYSHEMGSIFISASIRDNKVIVSFKDEGVGINEKHQNKLFNIGEVESTKGTKNEKGTGLGLILCKEFVEIHEGKIWVESRIGEGSTFNIELPLYLL